MINSKDFLWLEKSHFSTYCEGIYHLQRHLVPLLRKIVIISKNPDLQGKSKIRRRGSCGKPQQFTKVLRLPTIFHNMSKYHVWRISMPKSKLFAQPHLLQFPYGKISWTLATPKLAAFFHEIKMLLQSHIITQ